MKQYERFSVIILSLYILSGCNDAQFFDEEKNDDRGGEQVAQEPPVPSEGTQANPTTNQPNGDEDSNGPQPSPTDPGSQSDQPQSPLPGNPTDPSLGDNPINTNDPNENDPQNPDPTSTPDSLVIGDPEKIFIPNLPECEETENLIGVNVALMIDNSSSHAATDCPTRVAGEEIPIGNNQTFPSYRCGSETNREKATLVAYQGLSQIAVMYEQPSDAASRLSIISFPTLESYVDGSEIHTNWLSLGQLDNIKDAMLFTRRPFGLTPYQAGLEAAVKQFTTLAHNDKRKKLAILVTDGEPTDRYPISASSAAKELQNLGVEVWTVFVNSGGDRESRRVAHRQDLEAKQNSLKAVEPEKNWWLEGDFTSFDNYFDYLAGTSSQPSLVQRVSTQQQQDCVDGSAGICARNIIDLSHSDQLVERLAELIAKQGHSCQ